FRLARPFCYSPLPQPHGPPSRSTKKHGRTGRPRARRPRRRPSAPPGPPVPPSRDRSRRRKRRHGTGNAPPPPTTVGSCTATPHPAGHRSPPPPDTDEQPDVSTPATERRPHRGSVAPPTGPPQPPQDRQVPNRTLSFAYTACAAFAALLAFLLAATAEQTMFVLEDSEMVWITENEGIHDIDEVARTVQQVADDHGATIGYAVLDVHEPSSRVHLYLAVSDPDSHYAQWLRDGYPAFGRGFTVETHPITEFGEVGPNGYYFILGASDVRPVLLDALADHGLHEAPGTQVTELWHYFTGGHLFNLLAVALLATVAAVGAGVLLSARDYAVMRLQGHSYPGILLKDLAKVARLWAVALPAVAAATLVFLGVYNGWNQLGFYTPLALVFLAILALPCLAAHAAVLGLVHTTGILPALKGRLPVRSTTAAVYLVRV